MTKAFNGGFREDFGEALKSAREEKKYSSRKLAKEIGLTQPAITLFEQGKKQPSKETLQKICHILDKEEDHFARIPNR